MKFRNLLTLLLLIIITGCEKYSPNISNISRLEIEKKYNNKGFALIYNDELRIKNLDNKSLQIYHKSLKKNSFVKITNPVNDKSLIAKVKSNKVKFSNFYNSVISDQIVNSLDLNINEPYIEIVLISKNSTFIAKKAKTFEEEKKVAQKVPIDGIKIKDLNHTGKKDNENLSNQEFNYSIKVADFYYKKTANFMVSRIKSKTFLDNIKVIELSKTNYRVLLGPFNDIKSLKESFEKMNSLYFENIEIIKND